VDAVFKAFVETLYPSFERLIQMVPLKMSALPSRLGNVLAYLPSGHGELTPIPALPCEERTVFRFRGSHTNLST
jgi:hypothetical protein